MRYAPLLLWEFRYRDPLTGKWTKARYRAELHESSNGMPSGRQSAFQRCASRTTRRSIPTGDLMSRRRSGLRIHRIDIDSRDTVVKWARALGISPAHLRALVAKLGDDVDAVRANLDIRCAPLRLSRRSRRSIADLKNSN